ncbi:hydroxymethylglutaryl-CoA synthase [Neoconidiobolus thromboides FSU 785]|nr:hydroxymethylglutaryl-CoA synthase [Neoconidiobolus thromboides FSU 785]
MTAEANSYPENVGIVAADIYFPKRYVAQDELEQFDGVSAGKYTIGLGQTNMAFCGDSEDINSICLTVVKSLMEKFNIDYKNIGRMEVGTETVIDKSKSVKTALMELFKESGNYDIEGVDTTNACYGGTSALFNAISWVESSYWDGRYALVVCGDIAVYNKGPARPTGGCGAVAMLVGKNAPIVFDRGLRASHMEHVYDFYKPDLMSEYPVVNGVLSVECYLRSVDNCYSLYKKKFEAKNPGSKVTTDHFDYSLFHSPYTKLVQKSYGRFAFNDFLDNPNDPRFAGAEEFKSLKREDTYANKLVEKAFINYSKKEFGSKVSPTLLAARQLGNMYTASVYGGLVSLLCEIPSEDLLNKRVSIFSYGSGSASSLFSFTIVGSVQAIADKIALRNRLESRTKVEPAEFDKVMQLRETTHHLHPYKPQESLDNLFPNTFYLTNLDEKSQRDYAISSPVSNGLH